MSLEWATCSSSIKAWGKVKYVIWPSHSADGFYAKAGLECIGKTPSQKEAIQLCNKYEESIS